MTTQPDPEADLSDLKHMFEEFAAHVAAQESEPSEEFIRVMGEAAEHDPETLKAMWDAYGTHMGDRVEYLSSESTDRAIDQLKVQYLESGAQMDPDTEDFASIVAWNAAQSMLSMLWDADLLDMEKFVLLTIPDEFVTVDMEDEDDDDDGHLRND